VTMGEIMKKEIQYSQFGKFIVQEQVDSQYHCEGAHIIKQVAPPGKEPKEFGVIVTPEALDGVIEALKEIRDKIHRSGAT